MKICVTGGAGFIASHIVDRYIALGHNVVVIDNLATGNKANINPEAVFYEGDIRNADFVHSVFTKEKPEILNHHAAQLDVRKSVADPVFDAEVNIIGFLNLLQEGIVNNIQKVIFASSGGVVYGDATIIPTPENYQPLTPISPYGVTKLASELYLNFYKQVHHIPFVALRYANIYGPRQNPHGEAGVVAIFTKKLLKEESPIIHGDGKQVRDYTFVSDVVAANELALAQNIEGVFNIGTSKGTNVNELFNLLVSLTHSKALEQHGQPKPGEQQKSILSVQKANQILKWSPQVDLQEGLRQTVAFFKNEKK